MIRLVKVNEARVVCSMYRGSSSEAVGRTRNRTTASCIITVWCRNTLPNSLTRLTTR